MTTYTAVEQTWKRGKLVTGDYAIPVAGEDACYRCAGSFRSMPIAFVSFHRDGVEFLRVACEGFYRNKKAITAAYPKVWREAK